MEEKKNLYSIEEVAKHNTPNDLWVVVNDKVFDMSTFKSHPGGQDALNANAGTDATENFKEAGHEDEEKEELAKY